VSLRLGTSVTEFVAASYSAARSGTVREVVTVGVPQELSIWRGKVSKLKVFKNEFVFVYVVVARTV
jgi:hypothetical protein